MSSNFNWLHFHSSTGKFSAQTAPRRFFSVNGNMAVYSGPNPVYDCILLVVACAEHEKTLLQAFKSPHHYVPFFPFKIDVSWKVQIAAIIDRLFKSVSFKMDFTAMTCLLHQVTQIIVPRYRDILHQLVFFIEVGNCGNQCSRDCAPFKWFDLEEITVNSSKLWGPEPFLGLRDANNPTRMVELSVASEVKHAEKKSTLASSIGYTDGDLAMLFSEYIQHCFPSKSMNQVVLADYLAASQIKLTVNSKVDQLSRLYAACCITTGAYVTFRDLVFALVGLERRCQHGGIGGELRTRCIFRFYTRLGSSEMNMAELVTLFEDIKHTKGSHSQGKKEDPQKMAQSLFEKLKLKADETISLDRFIALVGSLEFRGTAGLFRAIHSPLSEVRRKQVYPPLWNLATKATIEEVTATGTVPPTNRRPCRRCDKTKYSLAVHSTFLDLKRGTLCSQTELTTAALARLNRTLRESSLETMNATRAANKMRQVLRSFSTELYSIPWSDATAKRPIKWECNEDRIALTDCILKLCSEAQELFRGSARVAKCNSPVYIFGDIHGNLKDLMIYDQHLWRMAPTGYVANAMFLGDYVDRGDYSLECILYLLAMKLLLPNRFHLLRGNHEIRYVQDMFTFHHECVLKFGNSIGDQIWEAMNQVFDSMPVCGVVDEQIFCAHGGIPAVTTHIGSLFSIPSPLDSPLLDKFAWEVLWNDPISRDDFQVALKMLSPEPDNWFPSSGFPLHFVPNTRRGTAYFYGEEAIDNFLEQNGLSFIIRAHEVTRDGFLFHHDGKAMTIFSSSNYCDSGNKAALVFIDGSKMRAIQVETNPAWGN